VGPVVPAVRAGPVMTRLSMMTAVMVVPAVAAVRAVPAVRVVPGPTTPWAVTVA